MYCDTFIFCDYNRAMEIEGEEMMNTCGTLFFLTPTVGKSKHELWYFISKIRNLWTLCKYGHEN